MYVLLQKVLPGLLIGFSGGGEECLRALEDIHQDGLLSKYQILPLVSHVCLHILCKQKMYQ